MRNNLEERQRLMRERMTHKSKMRPLPKLAVAPALAAAGLQPKKKLKILHRTPRSPNRASAAINKGSLPVRSYTPGPQHAGESQTLQRQSVVGEHNIRLSHVIS